ncbi:hypothetical protein FQA39_LY08892 [Lamprigera yunnana]|nr:hypothetical protein FQA39_LY08892 [Lamprigera yunnana]
MNDTIQGLWRRGGHNGQDFVKWVMSKILFNELASQYSWLGLKKGDIFKIITVGKRRRVRLRRSWNKNMRDNMRKRNLEEEALDRETWKLGVPGQ